MNKNEKTTQKTLLQLMQQLEEVFVALDRFIFKIWENMYLYNKTKTSKVEITKLMQKILKYKNVIWSIDYIYFFKNTSVNRQNFEKSIEGRHEKTHITYMKNMYKTA